MSADYQLEDTLYLPFTTRAFATGIPTALAGTPAIDIYEDVTATPIITGETLSVSLNSVAGFNMITVTATAATGFEAGKSYTAIIQAGTVGGVSVVGEVVAHFTLDKSAAAKDLANATDGLGALKTTADAVETDTQDIQSRLPAALVGGKMDSDATSISGDSAAADNLEAEYDNTGFKGYTRRNTAQAGAASSITLDAGASATDNYYSGQTVKIISGTGAGQARNVTTYTGSTKVADVIPNWLVTPSSDSVFVLEMGSVNVRTWRNVQPLNLVAQRVSVDVTAVSGDATAADNLESACDNYSATRGLSGTALPAAVADAAGGLPISDAGGLDMDALLSRQVVYEEGAVWIDLLNGAAGSTDFVNGTSRNPVDNIADANTLATSLGLTRFKVAPSNISNILTFAATQEYEFFDAQGAWISQGGQSVDGTVFKGCLILGIGTGAGNFENCTLGDSTHAGGIFWRCAVAGTVTLSGATSYYFDQCFGAHATPTIDFGAAVANTDVYLQDYNGEVNIENLGATGTDVLNISGTGHLILAASCTGGTVNIRGNWNLTNNGSGITINQDARFELPRILSDSTAFPGASVTEARLAELDAGNLPTDVAGVQSDTDDIQTRLPAALAAGGQMSSDMVAISGDTTASDRLEGLMDGTLLVQVNDAAATTTAFAADGFTEATDDHFNGRLITFVTGILTGQQTAITDYDAAGHAQGSQAFVVDALTEAPGNNDFFVIH